ncbi:leishmanolysin-like peptidase [Halichondria panicea]|uniref:leishmanolysin-like peptidase n=1 Tax=Halichondria panicea TaxID=6063 RepID=UPI00312BBAE3
MNKPVVLTTWVFCLLAAGLWLPVQASIQASDLDLLGQQQHTRPVKTLRDRIASGISGRSLARGALEPFTILPHYDPSIQLLTKEQQRVLKTVLMDSAVQWLSDALRARPMATPIKFERPCLNTHYLVNGVKYCRDGCSSQAKCGPVTIPEEHLASCKSCSRPGLQCENGAVRGATSKVKIVHFLLYVSAIAEAHCIKDSLYSGLGMLEGGHCLQEQEFDRPVAGYINFCPEALSIDPATFSRQQHALMHQLIHTLVFSEDLFPYYHNEEGYPRTRRYADGSVFQYIPSGKNSVALNTVRLVRRVHWTTLTPNQQNTVSMVVTPNVVREVRAHFGCESLEGAELENQGGGAVAGRHWENRVFGEELMTGMLASHHVLSRVTMALLHDSGWYLPDYSYAGQLSWGRGKGCLFVKDSCGGWMLSQGRDKEPLSPYCDGKDFKNERTGCVNGRTGVGPCLIRNYTIPLPQEYQYLSRRRGGTQILADYCPLYGMWEHGDSRIGSSCLTHTHSPPPHMNFALEEYGIGSRCFEQPEPLRRNESNKTSSSAVDFFKGVEGKRGGLCYKFSCSARRVLVRVGDETLRCGKEGRKQWFKYNEGGVTYEGSIVCPSYEELCAGYDCINRCSDHGTCHLGQCRCYHGYYGDDCSRSYAQKLLSCHNVTCLNGGTCNKSLEYGFECTCPPGLTGALCEQEIIADPCINVDCHRNGTCVRTDHGRDPKCNCYHGYEGQQCRLIKDLCLSEGRPCLNNGSCITNTTLCACPREWWGQHCENRVNFCVPINPCPQGHLCTHHNATQSYSCSCPHGYTGPTCSKLIVDHCAESPCHNNGTCVSLLDGFKCLCPRGYKGGRCKKLENPCKESPCGEGGRCRKLDEGQWGSITCECQHGYSGHFCELTA